MISKPGPFGQRGEGMRETWIPFPKETFASRASDVPNAPGGRQWPSPAAFQDELSFCSVSLG